MAIRGASGGAQQGEGEGFGVEGFASFGVGEGLLLGELQEGVIEGACGQGSGVKRGFGGFIGLSVPHRTPIFGHPPATP